jgi:hypothetical protein
VVARPGDVAREQGHLVGHAVRDPAERQVRVRHQQELRLGALERAQRGAVPEDPAGIALVVLAATTEEAVAAGREERAEHPVTGLDLGDRVARRNDGPDVLVPDHEPRLDRDPAVEDVEVRAADAGRLDSHHRVGGRRRLGIRPLLDADLAGSLEGHRAHGAGG